MDRVTGDGGIIRTTDQPDCHRGVCSGAQSHHGRKHAWALSSLHDVLRNDMTVDQFPEFFTFGLLEAWDIPGASR
jgi:hypothetical protein